METLNTFLEVIEGTRDLLSEARTRLAGLPPKQQGRIKSALAEIDAANLVLGEADKHTRGGLTIFATRKEAAELEKAATKARKEANKAKGTEEEEGKAEAATQAETAAKDMATAANRLSKGVDPVRSSLRNAVRMVKDANEAAQRTRLTDATQIEIHILNEVRQKTERAAKKIRYCINIMW
ncbi:hypothetical protein [Ktedonospora formicarum]|uniref:Uncharacterized protein n=1 Tax=Ktedonospora formicarum TaxID=2778364 RepID=A0A8J3I9B7_9CHLR|nr:hypothetical protein [Ktedonospora formicarum]GHO48153.1 hypothetical protein KSX_63160 [Ktedonospora formicarum]